MGSTERIRNVAKRVAKWARAGHQMVVVPSAMSGETNRLLGLAKELSPARRARSRARARHDRLDRRAGVGRACWRSRCRPKACEAVSYTGWQVPIADRQRLHQGAHPAHRRRARARRPRRRQGRRHRRLPGHRRRRQHHHARPRRLGHLGGGGGGGAEGRRVPDLHRRRRRLHHRPAHRARGAPAAHASASRRCSRWRASARKVLQIRSVEFAGKYRVPLRVLSSFTPWDIPLDEEAALGHADHFRGRREDGTSRRFRHRVQPRRGQDHRDGRARQAGHRLPDPRPGRRRQHRRRRDHPERVARRHAPTSRSRCTATTTRARSTC